VRHFVLLRIDPGVFTRHPGVSLVPKSLLPGDCENIAVLTHSSGDCRDCFIYPAPVLLRVPVPDHAPPGTPAVVQPSDPLLFFHLLHHSRTAGPDRRGLPSGTIL